MIRYTLKCENGHQFDSWFQSAEAFDTLVARGLTSCALCGSTSVEKALMAPRVASGEGQRATAEAIAENEPDNASEGALTTPSSPLERAVAKLRSDVEKNSDYVGRSFAQEARKMHEGEVPARSIYGEARVDEARALAEDGVPVMPLPFGPRDKAN